MSFLHEILQRGFQIFKLMADIVDKPQTHHFDFPGVFPTYFHSQKLLSPYLLSILEIALVLSGVFT